MVTDMITVSPRASVNNYWEHYKEEAAPDNCVTPDSQFVFLIRSKLRHIFQHKNCVSINTHFQWKNNHND